MKKLLLLIFTLGLSSHAIKAQITLNEMKTILNNDIDYIETFALSKGYSFKEIIKNDKKEGIAYAKGVEEDSKHLVFYSSFFEIGKKQITYQTGRVADYLLIKTQLIEQGFKLIDTYDVEGVLYKEYKNKLYKVTLRMGRAQYPDLREFYCVDIGFSK
jgi:hypothetical protein